MSIQSSRSLRPLVIGSLVVLSVACRSNENRPDENRSNLNTPSTSAESARSAPSAPGAMPDNRPSSTDMQDLNRDQRMPVAGRDDPRNDTMELGAGGSTGTGGSGGSKH